MKPLISIPSRIWKNIHKTESCWIWDGSGTMQGYGQVMVNRKRWLIHRYMYEAYKGPILDGLTIHHKCENKSCCRPSHLEAITHTDNTRYGAGWIKRDGQWFCKRDHLIDSDFYYGNTTKNLICAKCKRSSNELSRLIS